MDSITAHTIRLKGDNPRLRDKEVIRRGFKRRRVYERELRENSRIQ